MTTMIRKLLIAASLTGSILTLGACDPNGTYVGGSVYYDSMLWNDYYYGYPRPPRPDRPRPEHPIERPPVNPMPPIARPPVARPPIHRPPVARPLPARPR